MVSVLPKCFLTMPACFDFLFLSISKKKIFSFIWHLTNIQLCCNQLRLSPKVISNHQIVQALYLNMLSRSWGPQWPSGNTLASQLWVQWFKTRTLCRKDGSFLPKVSSLQYRTLTNWMYWFPLPIELPITI